MRFVEYTPQHFDALQRAVTKINPIMSLAHRPFVDYYYADNKWCRLDLILSEDGSVVATLGSERMTFRSASNEITIGMSSNFHSLLPGLGGYLWLRWQQSLPHVLVFGGSEDTHRMIRSQSWTYFTGVRIYRLNKNYQVFPGESSLRVLAKMVLRKVKRAKISEFAHRISGEEVANLTIREETTFTEDLLPKSSPFTFRFAPTVQHLAWRYNTRLSFIHYRLFRILQGATSIGYVILNDSPSQIIVAQSDGEHPSAIAYGTLLSLLHVGRHDQEPRSVLLSSSHKAMQNIFERFGFRAETEDRKFAIWSAQKHFSFPCSTSNWLINFDLGDNGLRAPFLDQ